MYPLRILTFSRFLQEQTVLFCYDFQLNFIFVFGFLRLSHPLSFIYRNDTTVTVDFSQLHTINMNFPPAINSSFLVSKFHTSTPFWNNLKRLFFHWGHANVKKLLKNLACLYFHHKYISFFSSLFLKYQNCTKFSRSWESVVGYTHIKLTQFAASS